MRAERSSPAAAPPLVMHIVHRFGTGGLENGIVNLINHLPANRWRHAVVAITDVDPAFSRRLNRQDVECISLHKSPGQALRIYPNLMALLRRLRPAVVHTRNLGTVEFQMLAWAVGVPVRIHGEHGRDMDDLDGSSKRHQWLRRIYRPFVQQYIALSGDLNQYLVEKVGISPARVERLCNGVDIEKFRPAVEGEMTLAGSPFNQPGLWRIGTVGRMQAVKAQTLLARAFVRVLELRPELRSSLRLVLAGDGPLRAEAQAIIDQAGLTDLAWLSGERSDVPDVMRSLDCFVLPSLAEGISNTILEAMASGLPVVATDVGGNADLVVAGRTGLIVPSADVDALAQALLQLAADPVRAAALGKEGRQVTEREYSLPGMVAAYDRVYTRLLSARADRS